MSIEWPTVIEGASPSLGASMQQPSDMESSAPHSLLRARSSRTFWLDSNGLARCCPVWRIHGLQTHLRVIHPPQKSLLARLLRG